MATKTKVTFFASNERRLDGKRIALHLTEEDRRGVNATFPVDGEGERVRVAEQPSTIVIDTVTKKAYRVQRKACGGGCMCDLSAVELDKDSAVIARKKAASWTKRNAFQREQYLTLAESLGLPQDWLDMDWYNTSGGFFDLAEYTIVGLQNKEVVIRHGLDFHLVPVDKTKEMVEAYLAQQAESKKKTAADSEAA